MLSKKPVNKLVVNWAASFLSVVLLLTMVAAPALAYVAANEVISSSIENGSILNRDIRANVISSSRIKNNTILNRDIHANVISSSRIRNVSDSKIIYSTKTKHLSLPAAAFTPMTDSMNYTNIGYALLPNPPAGGGSWVAPVSLPDGARITEVRLDCRDTSAGADLGGSLVRLNYPTNTPSAMASVGSAGNLPAWQHPVDNTIATPVIDNINNNYTVMVGAGTGDILFGGALITYRVKGP